MVRRRGREVEGTPLLREHPGKTWIEGSNPSVSAKQLANKRPSGRFFVLPPQFGRRLNPHVLGLTLLSVQLPATHLRPVVHESG